MPTSGNAAASTALPQPPNTSQNVAGQPAATTFPIASLLASSVVDRRTNVRAARAAGVRVPSAAARALRNHDLLPLVAIGAGLEHPPVDLGSSLRIAGAPASSASAVQSPGQCFYLGPGRRSAAQLELRRVTGQRSRAGFQE